MITGLDLHAAAAAADDLIRSRIIGEDQGALINSTRPTLRCSSSCWSFAIAGAIHSVWIINSRSQINRNLATIPKTEPSAHGNVIVDLQFIVTENR
jgi:meiotically up-regulated gene 157 (Mug157) protein